MIEFVDQRAEIAFDFAVDTCRDDFEQQRQKRAAMPTQPRSKEIADAAHREIGGGAGAVDGVGDRPLFREGKRQNRNHAWRRRGALEEFYGTRK